MKRIGIITMHKALSYGSALQTFALQKKICDLGYDATIIDYKYPNKSHTQGRNSLSYYFGIIVSFGIHMLLGFPNLRKKVKFNRFYKNYYLLSDYYPTEHSIMDNPPHFDIYITGSDQVWNPYFIKNDRTFLLSFVKDNSPRVSYGSSFAVSSIPGSYKQSYREFLNCYSFISVRESSGIDIVKELTGKDASLVCDPTLLLNSQEWDKLANESKMKIEEPYILVFILGYSFNPNPHVRNLVRIVKDLLNLKIVFLDGRKKDFFQRNSKMIKSAGPADFINLVKHASCVITDSFHGTIFSTIYSKPLIAVVKPGNSDSRIISFLKQVGKEECAIPYNSTSFDYARKADAKQTKELISHSLLILKKMLSF